MKIAKGSILVVVIRGREHILPPGTHRLKVTETLATEGTLTRYAVSVVDGGGQHVVISFHVFALTNVPGWIKLPGNSIPVKFTVEPKS